MPCGKRGRAIAAGLLVLCFAVPALVYFTRQRPPTKWPPGSDEERFALAFAAHDRERRLDTVSQFLQVVGIDINDHATPSVSAVAHEIAQRDGERAIPLLIGVIEADNSYDTVYSIGYSVMWLRGLTRQVEYSPFHDGPWWQRWWEAHRYEYPADVQAIPIPEFDKSYNGRTHTPFPDDIDTLQGKLRLAPELIRQWAAYPRTGDNPRIGARTYADELAAHSDPHAIPYLIGLGATDRYTMCEMQGALRKLTGIDRDFVEAPAGTGEFRDNDTGKHYHDRTGDRAWWEQWWRANRSNYPADVQAITIPNFKSPLVFDWTEKPAEKSQH